MRVLAREIRRAPANTPGLERVTRERRRYCDPLRLIVERGTALGIFVPVDSQIATEALAGLAGSLIDWFWIVEDVDLAAITETYSRLAVRVLCPTDSPQRCDSTNNRAGSTCWFPILSAARKRWCSSRVAWLAS